MAAKVDQRVYDRIVELTEKYGLTQEVISQRLGISARTVRVYLRAHRLNTKPYEVPNVSSNNSPAAA